MTIEKGVRKDVGKPWGIFLPLPPFSLLKILRHLASVVGPFLFLSAFRWEIRRGRLSIYIFASSASRHSPTPKNVFRKIIINVKCLPHFLTEGPEMKC